MRERFQPRFLSTRVPLLTLVIFLIGISALTFFTSRVLRQEMESQIGQQQLSTAAFIAEAINRELANRIEILEKVAERVGHVQPRNQAAMQALLEDRLILRGPFNGGVAFMDHRATVIAEVPITVGRIGINYSDRDYIMTALKQGRPAISPPVVGKQPQTPLFGIAVPVRDAQGRIFGTLVGAIFLDQPNFLDILLEKPYGKTGSYLLVAARERLVVTASDKARVREVLPPAGVIPAIDHFIEGAEGTGRLVNPMGVEVLVAVKRVPLADWYVAVTLPTREAFAPVETMIGAMLIASALLSLLAGGLTWWLVQRQLMPMRRAAHLLTMAEARNDSWPVLPVGQKDEAGILIEGFNHLLATVQAREATLHAREEADRRHLESLVEERTVALSVAKELAEAANRAKSTFLATMSHELKTPMNGIMGMIEIVRMRLTDPQQVEQLGTALKAARTLLTLINNILDLSKLEAERLALEPVDFTLDEVFAHVHALCAARVAEKALDFRLDLPPDLTGMSLHGDRLRLEQILLNLTGNALKFTDQGQITIGVARQPGDEAEVALRFEIRDSGIGIPAADLPRLFRAFEQVDGSLQRRYGGSGLGLAISKRLVEMMGGRIGVDSTEGEGSTFWFTLALKRTQAPLSLPA